MPVAMTYRKAALFLLLVSIAWPGLRAAQKRLQQSPPAAGAPGGAKGQGSAAGAVRTATAPPRQVKQTSSAKPPSAQAAKKQQPAAKKRAATPARKRSAQASRRKAASSWRRGQQQPSPERYMEIQQALIDKGYLDGPATGKWGPESAEALKRFQQDQKLGPTGKLDALSLIALGLGPKRDSPVRNSQVSPAPQKDEP